jgi:hypothetical protein
MITTTITIYDVTSPPPLPPPAQPVQKSLEVERLDTDNLVFRWTNQNEQPVEGTLGIVDWDEFLQQVGKLEPHRWTTDPQLPGPMGEGGMPNIMRQLKTTPTFQLFLAAMDVAAFLGVYQVGKPQQPHFLPYFVSRRFGELAGFVPSVVEGGRLFFVPDPLVAGNDQAVGELLQNGKLGKTSLTIDEEPVGSKTYVPYAVVSGFTTNVSSAARRLWDAVRNEYYASRD